MTARHQVEALRAALAIAMPRAEPGSFLCSVCTDAAHTLARDASDSAPEAPATAHVKADVDGALREVYRELAIAMAAGKRSPLAARREAATLLGVTSAQYRTVTA